MAPPWRTKTPTAADKMPLMAELLAICICSMSLAMVCYRHSAGKENVQDYISDKMGWPLWIVSPDVSNAFNSVNGKRSAIMACPYVRCGLFQRTYATMGCSCWVTLDQCSTLFGIRVQVASEKAVWNAQKSGHSLKSHQEVDRVGHKYWCAHFYSANLISMS